MTGDDKAVRIVALAPEDIERMAALARETWYACYPGIITVEQIEYMLGQRYEPALVRAELARRDIWWDQLLVATKMAAFSSYLLAAPGEMKLDKLYVHPGCQRSGYGGMLIDKAAEVARAQGCNRLTLAVNKQNRQAIGAYLKHGFRVADAVVKEIGNGFVMDDYVMELPLFSPS